MSKQPKATATIYTCTGCSGSIRGLDYADGETVGYQRIQGSPYHESCAREVNVADTIRSDDNQIVTNWRTHIPASGVDSTPAHMAPYRKDDTMTTPNGPTLESVQATLAELQTKYKALEDNLKLEQTAKGALAEKVKGYETSGAQLQAQLAALTTEHTTTKTKHEALENQHIQFRREILVKHHGVQPEVVKDFSATQLEALEKTLPAVKSVVAPEKNGYGAGGAGGAVAPKTAADVVQLAMDRAAGKK